MNIFNNFNSFISKQGGNNSISIGNGKATINGKTYNIPHGNISISGSDIYINGNKWTPESEDLNISKYGTLEIKIEGNCGDIRINHGSVEVHGNVEGKVDCGGSVTCHNISGYVDCGGSCNCGDVGGYVDCGGSCNCGNIKGSVDAGGSVSYRK